jgi:hypothetical protein
VLNEFVSYGARHYPARATLLVLSNHGTGVWTPPDGSEPPRRCRVRRRYFFPGTYAALAAPEPRRGPGRREGRPR